MHLSTIAERSPPVGLMPDCHQFVEIPSGSQPPVIGRWYGPGRGWPSTALSKGRRTRPTRARVVVSIVTPTLGVVPFKQRGQAEPRHFTAVAQKSPHGEICRINGPAF